MPQYQIAQPKPYFGPVLKSTLSNPTFNTGVPVWAFAIGAAAIVGVAGYFLLYKEIR